MYPYIPTTQLEAIYRTEQDFWDGQLPEVLGPHPSVLGLWNAAPMNLTPIGLVCVCLQNWGGAFYLKRIGAFVPSGGYIYVFFKKLNYLFGPQGIHIACRLHVAHPKKDKLAKGTFGSSSGLLDGLVSNNYLPGL